MLNNDSVTILVGVQKWVEVPKPETTATDINAWTQCGSGRFKVTVSRYTDAVAHAQTMEEIGVARHADIIEMLTTQASSPGNALNLADGEYKRYNTPHLIREQIPDMRCNGDFASTRHCRRGHDADTPCRSGAPAGDTDDVLRAGPPW